MPRGTMDTATADKEMNKSSFVKLTDQPQTLYLEGYGDPTNGKYGMVTPIYVVTEDLEPKSMDANGNLYRAFRTAEVEQHQKFEISVTKEAVTNQDGTQRYAEDGKAMERNVYAINKLEGKLTAEQQRTVMANSTEEQNIDDVPF